MSSRCFRLLAPPAMCCCAAGTAPCECCGLGQFSTEDSIMRSIFVLTLGFLLSLHLAPSIDLMRRAKSGPRQSSSTASRRVPLPRAGTGRSSWRHGSKASPLVHEARYLQCDEGTALTSSCVAGSKEVLGKIRKSFIPSPHQVWLLAD